MLYDKKTETKVEKHVGNVWVRSATSDGRNEFSFFDAKWAPEPGDFSSLDTERIPYLATQQNIQVLDLPLNSYVLQKREGMAGTAPKLS